MRHRVKLGDCYKLLPIACDLIVTDPPYGISYKSNRQGIDRKYSVSTGKDVVSRDAYFSPIANDKEVPTRWMKLAYRSLTDGGAIYVFTRWDVSSLVMRGLKRAGFTIKNQIILYKSNHGMGDLKGSYAPKYECLIFATKGRHLLRGKRLPDVWEVPVKFNGSIRLHPNEKPISWYMPCIEKSSDVGSL